MTLSEELKESRLNQIAFDVCNYVFNNEEQNVLNLSKNRVFDKFEKFVDKVEKKLIELGNITPMDYERYLYRVRYVIAGTIDTILLMAIGIE